MKRYIRQIKIIYPEGFKFSNKARVINSRIGVEIGQLISDFYLSASYVALFALISSQLVSISTPVML